MEENIEVKYFEVIGEVITRLVSSIQKTLTRLTLARLIVLETVQLNIHKCFFSFSPALSLTHFEHVMNK